MSTQLVSMLKSALKNLLKSEAAEKVVSLIVSVFFKIPLDKVERACAAAKDLVLDAAKNFPMSGSGQQKWDWVWDNTKDVCAEFINTYGEQAMELVILFVLKALTAKGEKT